MLNETALGCPGIRRCVPYRGMRYGRRNRTWGVARPNRAVGLPRWRSKIAAAVVAFLVVLMGHSAMRHHESHAPHHPHALLSSLGGEFAVNVDHAHLFDASLTDCHAVYATAVLPRSATTLIGLGIVAAAVALTAVLANLVVPAGRGPPAAPLAVRNGQDLLTRLCLARR